MSHVATDAKNATTAAKEAKTIATKAQSDASEAKSTIANLTNTFSHDADGAHVGDKAGIHTTIDRQGMKLLNGTKQLAAFDAGMVTLGGTALNIVAGYSNGRDDRRSTALFASDLLLKPTTSFDVEAQYTGLRITNADRMNTTAISTNWDSFSVSTNNGANKANITFNDFVKLLKFTPWTDLVNNSSVRVRYCVRCGVMYLDCFLTGGYPTYTTTAQIPSDLLPSNAAYYSLGTQNSNNTAKIWLGAAGGGDGHVYFYNYDSGYCSGVVPIIPKSLE